MGWRNERWKARRDRAGRHGEQVHHALVEQGQRDLVPVQADEIRVKGRKMIVWMGLAMMVSTRLWLGGAVSLTRDRRLADRLMRASCMPAHNRCELCSCVLTAGQLIQAASSGPSVARSKRRLEGDGPACRSGPNWVSPPSSSARRRNGWGK